MLLAIPAIAWNGEDAAELRERWSRTVTSITDCKLLEQRAAARDASAIGELIAATEPGPADNVQAELDLVQLRGRVAVLQQILDARAIENGEEPAASAAVEFAPALGTERSRSSAAN
ncbi:MAG TPA: hypothetical protein VM509_12380, partial [Planctomycetota bacterium]|nr:hypothetical protein [Planctomycetota bacterium]